MDRPFRSWLGTPREWAIDVAAATVAGFFLGLIGPFGSFFNDTAAALVIYWVLALWCATLVLGVVCRLGVALAPRWGIPVALALAGSVVVASGPLSLLVAQIARLFWPRIALSPLDWYWQSLVISAPLVLVYAGLRHLLARRGGEAPLFVMPAAPEASPATPPAAGEVLCLRMEDHYVRIYTAVGSRLVEGPFERVIATLGDQEGLRVHRSWWVARAAVLQVEADGRNLRLRLQGDLSAPVSRASVARLREAGWLSTET